MTDVLFARSQMGMSLAFHIIFAAIGMAMPLLMAVSEDRVGRASGSCVYHLARWRPAKCIAD
jgi:cytochrome bd ubiquinol oxidase subunit I